MKAALVGKGISQSLTPPMHEAEGRALGLNYAYELMDTETPAFRSIPLSDIVSQAQADGYAGLNITHPYKIEILQHLDDLSENACRLGAVNTVVFDGGKSIGHNTDHSGFARALGDGLTGSSRKSVLLLGAGGAGAAVAFALLESGTKTLLIHDLEHHRAAALATKLRTHHPRAEIIVIDSLTKKSTIGICGLVNTTPMGMLKYPGTAFPSGLLHSELWVADIVYFPLETQLLADARALGCQVMAGSKMAIWQAVLSFEHFTHQKANPDRFHKVFGQLCDRRD